jgi:hypothetical protein
MKAIPGTTEHRTVTRTEIEATISRDRAWLLETYEKLTPEDRTRGVTPSEHDPALQWSALDHLVHLAGIERNFNAMIRRHLAGDANPVGLINNPDGSRRTLEEIMKPVHRMNEDWVAEHRGKPLTNVVALGQQVRGETFALLSELSDEQLAQKLRGAPWADGTVGGVIATAGGHGRMHWKWLSDAAGWKSGTKEREVSA